VSRGNALKVAYQARNSHMECLSSSPYNAIILRLQGNVNHSEANNPAI
jgi:hypothetical protein